MERLFVGDEVQVMSGKDNGRRGKVTKVLREVNKVVVEGLNQATKHVKGVEGRAGSKMKIDAPIPACKVMPVDPETGKPTRVRFEVREGKKVRVAVKSGVVLERKSES
jgi:large subunit ribosomal protein L24